MNSLKGGDILAKKQRIAGILREMQGMPEKPGTM